MQKPIYALHRDCAEQVLAASSFTHIFQLNDWMRGLDVRPGDKVEFHETSVRPNIDDAPPAPPAPAAPPAAPTAEQPL